MKNKEVMFKFRDGLKPVSVGDKVLIVESHKRNSEPYLCEVVSIGKQYIHVSKLSRIEKFDIATGSEKTEYSKSDIYSSMEGYLKAVELSKKIEQMRQLFSDTSSLRRLTEEEIDQVTNILSNAKERVLK